MKVDTKEDIGPWRTCRVFLNNKLVEYCIYADDTERLVIREWTEDVVVTPPEPVKRQRAIVEYCTGDVRIELS